MSDHDLQKIAISLRSRESAQLLPHQHEHFSRVDTAACKTFGYLDTSPTGTGKTYVSCNLARKYKLNILVVGPVSVLPYWNMVAEDFGVNVLSTLSYAALRGASGKVNHAFLDRNGKGYSVTGYFRQCLEAKVLLIFDEVHNLKNIKTNQRAAALTLVRAIIKANNGSRIGLLSATPFDKNEHCASIIMLLGLTLKPKLYQYNPRTRIYLEAGIRDVIERCRQWNPEGTHKLDEMRANFKSYPYELYSKILKFHCSSSMPTPKLNVVKDVMNGFYKMPQEDVIKITNAQRKLRAKLRKNENGDYVRDDSFREATAIFITEVERAKVPTLVRLAKETLTQNTQAKVIIYVWRRESVSKLASELQEFEPAILNGEVKAKDRTPIIDGFQQPTAEFRLIISHPVVGGVGISLDDTDGEWPRYMFVSPNYHHILLHQATGRIYRTNTKSDATIRFVYSQDCTDETSILNALARKDQVVKGSLYQVEESIQYPGSYQGYIEN